ncbi:unnamed protein product [Candidula unifasciata]|uniref:Uncharacterized protein n=1 Tax=Candidula unifasciata TaxID=100452 RepID=A0A8S3Z3C8_9EUPU|nr:unnamed protein product [Candidula unifasciata]
MTQVVTVPHPGHRVAPKGQETRLKGHWLQDDNTDSLELDKLLAELQSFPDEQNAKGLYQNGLSDDAGVKGYEDGTETRVHCPAHSELSLRLQQLNDSSKKRKQLESNVKNMPVLDNVGTHKNIEHSRSFNHDSQRLKQNVPSADEIVERKSSQCDSGQKNKLQADIINTIQSKSQTLGVSSILVNDAHISKPAVVFANTAPAATLSLAELARQHKSQRARVASLESDNEKLNKQSAVSTPLVLGCRTSTGSLTDLPASYPETAATSSGVSLSQLALQHRNSKPPLSTVSPGNGYVNGYVNGYKPSLLQLMKNVAIDDTRTSSAAEAPYAQVPQKPSSSLSLTLCLKVNKPSDTSTKLPYGQQKQDTEDLAVGNTFIMMDSESVESNAGSQEQSIPTDLIPRVSSVGFVLCCLKRKRKLEDSSANIRTTFKYPKFKCVSQVGQRILYPEIVYRKIEPFDFSTLSPDDLVKHKQKQAFTRPQKEFEF